jgi:hypothetical protein
MKVAGIGSIEASATNLMLHPSSVALFPSDAKFQAAAGKNRSLVVKKSQRRTCGVGFFTIQLWI